MIGVFLFTVASALCGSAPTLWLLIAARAAQGLGAAIMMALPCLILFFVGQKYFVQGIATTGLKG